MKNIGFIGLGIMGKPMALNLIKRGYRLTVFDINEEAVREVAKAGATAAQSPKDVALKSELTFTMLPNSEHVKSVIFDENGLIEGVKAGSIIVDMSSISPVVSRDIAQRLAAYQVEMLDAPVSGGEPKAIDGTVSIMVGGKEEVFAEVEPVLQCMGKDITLVGDHGSGTTAKLANQIIVNVNIAAMAEALALATKAGIDIEKMYQAIRGGLAGSAVLDAKVPMILERDFKAGGRIDINAKDLRNVLATAEELEMPLPLSGKVAEMFEELIEDGKATLDHCGLVQYYEKHHQIEVGKGGVAHG
ncbi:2-hydroxy-3-oxopropionate reductase [Halalkalibacter oceani]|uniref:2-hydroxy-3-oxopropionate reductase n=1 Tax=Halalkalibacter oceani TaxID=1653776 RepID=A0A9X2IMQ5_9BACI|nr:2-hydroxy-3-oxopropionate reductase [Halalkalibacter oceani]MCM3713001.1 2-hydroxy-3-oxopropionate reductase [Halalkalibacter oceani]